ncbi:MAG: 4Fe-4S dicluster domain-containing protein [Syntrophales bacterium]
MKRVYQKEEVCIGCHLCEIGCIVEHSALKDPIRAFKEVKPRPQPRNIVEEAGPLTMSVNCRHCDEPPCVHVCISGALYKDYRDGVVRHLEEKCVGCWSCIMACPFGVIRKNPAKEKVMKCDLCPDRKTPACVEACPNRALVFEER